MKVIHSIKTGRQGGPLWEAILKIAIPESFLAKFSEIDDITFMGEELSPRWGYSADLVDSYHESDDETVYGATEKEAQEQAEKLLSYYLQQIKTIKAGIDNHSEEWTDTNFTEV